MLPKYITYLDTIALKAQNATFTFQRTERVDEKKKKEVEIIEEWTEDNSRYVDLSGLVTYEQIAEFVTFAQCVAPISLEEKVVEDAPQEGAVVDAEQVATEPAENDVENPILPARVPHILGVISLPGNKVDLDALKALGNVEFIKYSADITELISNSAADYVVITDLEPDFKAIQDLDWQIMQKYHVFDAQFV